MNHGCMAMTLKPKPNHPNRTVQKFGQIVKVLSTVFFDCNDVVHHKFLPQSRTVNKECYLEVLHRLREVIVQILTELWKNQTWILHHDNAPAYISMLVLSSWPKAKP